jgi:competence protein ComEC
LSAGTHRPAVLPALALIAGLASRAPAFDAAWPAAPVASAAAVLVALWLARARPRRVAFVLGLWAWGLVAAGWAVRLEDPPALAFLPADGAAVTGHLEGRLLESPEPLAGGDWRLRLRGVAEPRAGSRHGPLDVTLSVSVATASQARDLAALRRGDLLRTFATVRRPPTNANPGMATQRRIAGGPDAVGRVKSARLVEPLQTGAAGPLRALDALRAAASQRLARRLDKRHRAALDAMLLGRRGGLHERPVALLRRAGLGHLLAISGLHVGLLLTWSRRVCRRVPYARSSTSPVLGTVLPLFAIFAGSRSSVWRAAAGGALPLWGRAVGRAGDPLNTLGLSAMTLLAIVPSWLRAPGFQLSFLAASGIVLFSGRVRDALPLPRWIGGLIGVTASAYVATAPVLALRFGWLAPVALLSNVPAVPLCALALGGGAITILSGEVEVAARLAAGVAATAIDALFHVASIADRCDLASGVSPPPPVLVTVYYGALILLARTRQARRQRVVAAAVLAAAIVGLHVGTPPLPSGPIETLVLDVGQGQAVAVLGPAGTVVVDAGDAGARFDLGQQVVLPVLRTRAIRRVDVLVLTHGHRDHVGGARALIEGTEVGELWMPPGWHRSRRFRILARRARGGGAAVWAPEAGRTRGVGGIPLEVLWPRSSAGVDANNHSIVLRAGNAPHRILLPGDLEAEGERGLVALDGSLEAEAIVLPHHGSRGSSTTPFLARVGARIALVSCGRHNRFGHPHPETVTRVRRAGAELWRTDLHGMLHAVGGEDGWSVRPFVEPAAGSVRSTNGDQHGHEREEEDHGE